MSNFQKAAALTLKIIGSAIITIGIIAILETQGEKRRDIAENTFDSLKDSILSIFPETDGAEVSSAVAAENNQSDEESEDLETSSTITYNISRPQTDKVSQPDPERLTLEKPAYPPSEAAERRKGLRKVVPEEFPEVQKIEDTGADNEKNQIILKQNIDIDTESLNELISQSLTIAINEIKMPVAELKALEVKLENAENFIDLKNLNFEKITAITARVGLFVALERKAKRIGERLGGDESNNYYKPNFEINDDLEISSITPREGCPADVADEIIRRIKRLPEYKKLHKKKYFKKNR